jgi:hypothetical protein
MAKRQSIAARAKKAENRIARFLWGDAHLRDWESRWDVSGPSRSSNVLVGEVKDWKWGGPQHMWTILIQAYKQVQDALPFAAEQMRLSTSQLIPFAVYLPPNCLTEHAITYWIDETDTVRINSLQAFRDEVVAGCQWKTPEEDPPSTPPSGP